MLIAHVLLYLVLAAVVLLAVIIFFSARSMAFPGRAPLWTDPKKAHGIAYEHVVFPATDGTRLKGWFVPPPAGTVSPASTIVIMHGWLWNRLGNAQDNVVNDFPGGKRVELLPLAFELHKAGYAVLMFDFRNFGESDTMGVYTGGWLEHRDLLGALDYLETRGDVDQARIGAIGFSFGGNCIAFALAHTKRLRAAIAVQPATVSVFMENYTRPYGAIGRLLAAGTQFVYSLCGGPKLSHIQPALALRGAANTPVLYVESTGDKWGTRDDVQRMVAATPNAETLFPETKHRFEGYQYLVAHPEITLAFFARHMPR